jgi:hypothetical protein
MTLRSLAKGPFRLLWLGLPGVRLAVVVALRPTSDGLAGGRKRVILRSGGVMEVRTGLLDSERGNDTTGYA